MYQNDNERRLLYYNLIRNRRIKNMTNNNKTFMKGKLRNALFDVERELGTSLPVSFLTLLLSIPLDKPMAVTQLRKMSSLGESGVSRALSMMAQHRTDKGRKVPKFLTMYDDPMDRRHRLIELNDNGRRFIGAMLDRLTTD